MNDKKSLVSQIIDFITKYKDDISKESFAVIELVIAKGRLDGMRIKKYIKNKEEK